MRARKETGAEGGGGGRQKNKEKWDAREMEERGTDLSLSLSWMDHGFLCPSGVYSVDGALVIAVDARVLMDTPDADEKK